MLVAEADDGGQVQGVLDQLHRDHLRLRRGLREGSSFRAGKGKTGEKNAAGQDHELKLS